MNQFAGNMLQLINKKNEKILVMSSAAWNSLTPHPKRKTDQLITGSCILLFKTLNPMAVAVQDV